MKNTPISPELLAKLRISNLSNVPSMVPVVKIDDAPFAIKGDISVIGGKEKAGKTSSAYFIVATALMPLVSNDLDTLSIRSTFCSDKPVIFVDTEQSRASTKKFCDTVTGIVGDVSLLKNFYAYNLRSLYKSGDKKAALDCIFQIHSDAHLIIIDGIADLVSDSNLPEPSNELIAELMSKAEKLYTCIVVFIHENPGQSTKFRGNLGSELQRKCYGAIGIKKDRQKRVHCIESRLLRHSGDFDDIYFRYSKEHGRMVSLSNQESEDYKFNASGEREKRELRYKLAYQCLVGGSERIRYNELIRRIINHMPTIEGKSLSETTAKSRIKEMLEYNIIEKTQEDRYALVSSVNSMIDKPKPNHTQLLNSTHTPLRGEG